MHYYVDGYNLLFKEAWARSCSSLEEARSRLIQELDSLAHKLNLLVTVVFDAPFQSDDLRRGHFRSLEIIFTAKGQIADDFLKDVAASKGNKIVIVTSDRPLARIVKASGSQVEGVHDFIIRLRKKSCKKQQELPQKSPQKQVIKVVEAEKPIDMNNLPPLSDLPAWERIFSRKDLKDQNDKGQKGHKGPKGPKGQRT
jgi:Predicted RNA-binding protein containing a PIN domain